jgi:hypothetical protein
VEKQREVDALEGAAARDVTWWTTMPMWLMRVNMTALSGLRSTDR